MINYYNAAIGTRTQGTRRLILYDVNCLRLYLENSLYFSITPIKHTVCQVKEDDALVLCQTEKKITYYDRQLQHFRTKFSIQIRNALVTFWGDNTKQGKIRKNRERSQKLVV